MKYQQHINGEWVDALSCETLPLLNPATEAVIATISLGDAADCNLAIDAAQTAFAQWSQTTPFFRAEILKKAANYIRENIVAFAHDMVLESGKPLTEAKGEWAVAANLLEWYAEEGKRSTGKTLPTSRSDKRSYTIWQPIGVIGIITAWNFPSYNPARAWAAALAAGCTVVAKPSENTPISAVHLATALIQSGLPRGVINLVCGNAAAIGNAMLQHPSLKKISFTGSTRVGKLLMDGASATHTKLSLELGGNAPVIIFDDVDVPTIAKAAAAARFRNNGQVCIAPQRFYIHEKIYHQFAELVTAHVAALQVNHGFEETVNVGPLITQQQQQSVLQLLAKAQNEGAILLTGGTVPAHTPQGYFVQPAVVGNLSANSCLAHNEIFGPVLPLFAFTSFEDAIAQANNTEYGLAAYVFTNHLQTALRASEQLHFGMVGINEWTPHGTELPFGGWNYSGQGHESGAEGLYEYLEKKLVSIGGI